MITISVNPVAFSIGPVDIRWYGIMMSLAVMTLVGWMLLQIRRTGKFSYDTVLTAAIIGVPAGLAFSKALHVIDLWSFYSQFPGQIFTGEGLTIYGAILGVVIGLWAYSKIAKFNLSQLLDLAVPGVLVAQAIGRVGCTLNGCCYGVSTGFLNVVYTNPNSAAPVGTPVSPTQVYEILFLLATLGVVLLLRKHLKMDGTLFMVYISLYSAWRVGIGFLRVGTPFLFGLEQAQVIGILVLAVTLPLLALRLVKSRVAALPTS